MLTVWVSFARSVSMMVRSPNRVGWARLARVSRAARLGVAEV
jgi:hypothetical protein